MKGTFIVFTVVQVSNPLLQKLQHKEYKDCSIADYKN